MSETINYHPPDPLKPAFIRLEDAHRLWHQAENEYFDPDGFRIALNACIQTLRSVTFVLQKNKGSIEGFEQWYSGWQEKLNADTVLRWSVQARNRIVKEGDLELHSILRVSVVASYYDPPYQEFSAKPSSKTKDIVDSLNPKQIPEHVLKHGFLRLERRWVDDSLATHELLDALAHCYSTLSLLLHDISRILDPNAPKPALASGVLPCMIRSDEDRAVWIRLSTGAIEPVETVPVQKTDMAKPEEVIERYGDFDVELPPTEFSFLKKMAFDFFQRARIILEKDKYHDFLVFLVLPDNEIAIMKLLPEDQADKYRLWREIAANVAKTDAIGVISIAEVWLAQYDPAYPLRHASESPNRTEALYLVAISKDGEQFALVARFSRQDEQIILEKTTEQELGEANFFEPIRRVWKNNGHKPS